MSTMETGCGSLLLMLAYAGLSNGPLTSDVFVVLYGGT
jgi:hypothetical protein